MIILAWLIPLGKQASAVEGVFDTVVRPATNRSESLARLFHNVDSRKGADLHNFGNDPAHPGQRETRHEAYPRSAERRSRASSARTSYDEYTGTGWTATDRDTARVDARGTRRKPRREPIYIKRVGHHPAREDSRLREHDSHARNAADHERRRPSWTRPKGFKGDIERIRSRVSLDPGDSYTSFGSVSTATQKS